MNQICRRSHASATELTTGNRVKDTQTIRWRRVDVSAIVKPVRRSGEIEYAVSLWRTFLGAFYAIALHLEATDEDVTGTDAKAI
jgi:hypothetical protein